LTKRAELYEIIRKGAMTGHTYRSLQRAEGTGPKQAKAYEDGQLRPTVPAWQVVCDAVSSDATAR
jgi:hypothetical protein